MIRLNRAVRIVVNGFLAEIVILALIASFLTISLESTIVLLIFNLLFVSFIFQLNGTLIRKLSQLAVGNTLGCVCNYILIQLGAIGGEHFGQTFNVLYAVSYPIVNTLWIVTFWSLSLSNLPKPTDSKLEVND